METRITAKAMKGKWARVKSIALPALMACTLTLPAFSDSANQSAQPQEPGKHNFGRFHHFQRGDAWQQLNLTEAQKTQMKQIREGYRERTQSLRQELRAKKQQLHQANQGTTFNEGLATQVLTESAALEAKLMGERFKMRQEMMALLTPEQKNQLEQMREQHKMKSVERQSS